jgi:hypothetical protein
VIPSTVVTAATMVVGDFAVGATSFIRDGVNVRSVKNGVTLVAKGISGSRSGTRPLPSFTPS